MGEVCPMERICLNVEVKIIKEIEMIRNRFLSFMGILFCASPWLVQAQAQSQTDDDVPRYEVGAQFTSITKPNYNGGHTEIGPGARFTFNLNRSIALEAVGNFFPHKCSGCGASGDNDGNITQGLFGVKAGKRFQRWGIFAKARPGVISFSQGDSKNVATGNSIVPFDFVQRRLTNFAFDLGGVLEFYPSKRIVTRFDAGDTLIKYRRRESNILLFEPFGSGVTVFPFTVRAETRHNFQFSAGVGFRF